VPKALVSMALKINDLNCDSTNNIDGYDQQWIGTGVKGLGPLKHVVRGSIHSLCVPRKFGWEGKTHPMYGD
jgi:hypothetical protein